MKSNKSNNPFLFIICIGLSILCIFTAIVVSNLIPSNNKNDSYEVEIGEDLGAHYVDIEEFMKAKVETLDMENNKLKITMSGDVAQYCVKSTKSTPKDNALCWKKVENNKATTSVYQNKKYYVWLKDTNGDISTPITFNTKK